MTSAIEIFRSANLLIRQHGANAKIFAAMHADACAGVELYRHVTALGAEGVVSKQADAPYRSGHGRTQVEVKPADVRERQAESVARHFRHKVERKRPGSKAARLQLF